MKQENTFNLILDNYLIPLLREMFGVFGEVVRGLVDILSATDTSKYNAAFASANSLLSRSNEGFCLDGRRMLSSEFSQRNALIIAPTGMGKSTVVVIPSLLKTHGSFVINDPSGELYEKSAGFLYSEGYDIRVINFSDPSVSGYNPLARIESTSDCNKIAFMLVRSVLGHNGEPFWRLQGVSLISFVMEILRFEDIQYRNFANVRHVLQLLSIDPAAMDKMVARTGSTRLINEYKQFLTYDHKVQSGVIATCLAALQIFTDPSVAQVTSADSIQLENLRNRKTVIFIHSSTSDMKYYSVLISIMFEQITKAIMTKLPDKEDLPVYFILDELSSLYLPTLQITAANIRKFKGGLILILQDFQQLIDIYSRQEAESIRSNTFAKMYFGGQSHPTAIEISQQLGKYEVEDEKGARRIRELRTPDEVRQIESSTAILICANYKPILLNLTPYYKNPFLKLKTELPPPLLKGQLPEVEVQLIET